MAWPLALIHTARGGRRLLAAFLAGSFSVLAMAPFDLWPILFVTFPVLVWLLDGLVERHANDRKALVKKAATTGWAFGFGYLLFGLYWIANAFLVEAGIFIVLMPFAMTLMPAALALYFALATSIGVLFWSPGLTRVLLLAVTLSATEWLRGHLFTGLPWNLLGHAFAAQEDLSQLFSLAGPSTLSLICVLVFASPAIAFSLDKNPLHLSLFSRLKPVLVSVFALLIAGIWGHLRLAGADNETVAGVNLRLVQPNIKQVDKWRPGNAAPIYQSMLKWSRFDNGQGGLDKITHLIWPESALPFFMARSKEALKGIDKTLPDGVTLITGAMRFTENKTKTGETGETERTVYNSLYVLDDKATITRIFDKKHLVPFGEYLPYRSVLELMGLRQFTKIRGGFASGMKDRLIRLSNAPPFAPQICYEVIFADEIIEKGERPSWLLNLTNDGWYGMSTGPYQHFVQSRLRAIEQGLPMVRVANTGISGVIDPYGRVTKSLPLGRAGIVDAPLPAAISPPLYAHFGDLIFMFVLGGIIGLVLLIRLQKIHIST